MNTLDISTLQAIQHFSVACKIQYQKTCPIYPISRRVHRQPAARKLVRSKEKTRPKVQRRNSRTVVKKNNLEATKKSPFVAKRIFAHKNSLPFHHYSMEQFVLVPLSVYNSSTSPTTVTRQELPKYKPEQTPTYHKVR